MQTLPSRRLSVAPMMDWTDRHDRVFLRQISSGVRLYTEMLTSAAVLHGDRRRLLAFDACEHPVALQLGGSEPDEMARAAEIGAGAGYDEINMNVGCPSDRVQAGRFGACLMAEPQTVADCVAAMIGAVDVPVTVKTRIGIDDMSGSEGLVRLTEAVAEAGCRTIVVHARKAWLNGLSPKENREVPPLDYEAAYALKARFPELTVVVNGGIADLDAAEAHLDRVDGVMLGRAAYRTPWVLAGADRRLLGLDRPPPDRFAVAEAMARYAERQAEQGVPVKSITRHMTGLFQGLPGGRIWRRHLSEAAHRPGAGAEVIRDAAALAAEAMARAERRRAA